MKKVILFFIFYFLNFADTYPQIPGYDQRIKVIYDNITKYFYDFSSGLYRESNNPSKNEHPHSFLWPLCALLQAVNEMEYPDSSDKYMQPVMRAIDKYYTSAPPASAYQASVVSEAGDVRYYDDNQWIAIACLDAYKRTGKDQYLKTAKNIYRFMMTGYDTVSGGGIYWREGDKSSKNTCSNGPGILISLQLYRITGEKGYLDTALLIYHWVNKSLLSPQGIYFDAIRLPSGRIDSAKYTYNTGTMLQSNVLLYEITKERKYFLESISIADAAESFFYRNSKLPGFYWFNAVLLRGYMELYSIEKDKNRLNLFVREADRVWKQEKDNRNLIGRSKTKKLIDQAAMLEIYARLNHVRL